MSDKKGLPFPLIIITIILGWAAFKQFDFETLKFEKPALATLYLVTFVVCVYLILKKKNKDKS